MQATLDSLQEGGGIERFCIREDAGDIRVDIWMNGTSYIDKVVTKVRTDVEAKARQQHRCVKITIAAILECFEVPQNDAMTKRTYHQSVGKTD